MLKIVSQIKNNIEKISSLENNIKKLEKELVVKEKIGNITSIEMEECKEKIKTNEKEIKLIKKEIRKTIKMSEYMFDNSKFFKHIIDSIEENEDISYEYTLQDIIDLEKLFNAATNSEWRETRLDSLRYYGTDMSAGDYRVLVNESIDTSRCEDYSEKEIEKLIKQKDLVLISDSSWLENFDIKFENEDIFFNKTIYSKLYPELKSALWDFLNKLAVKGINKIYKDKLTKEIEYEI